MLPNSGFSDGGGDRLELWHDPGVGSEIHLREGSDPYKKRGLVFSGAEGRSVKGEHFSLELNWVYWPTRFDDLRVVALCGGAHLPSVAFSFRISISKEEGSEVYVIIRRGEVLLLGSYYRVEGKRGAERVKGRNGEQRNRM